MVHEGRGRKEGKGKGDRIGPDRTGSDRNMLTAYNMGKVFNIYANRMETVIVSEKERRICRVIVYPNMFPK